MLHVTRPFLTVGVTPVTTALAPSGNGLVLHQEASVPVATYDLC